MRYRFLLVCLIFSGFAGLAYELLWVRLLALSFGSTAASFSTVLAVFFGGLAIGSWLGGRVAKRVSRPIRAYALLELGTGLSALVLYPAIVQLETLFGRFDPGPTTWGTILRLVTAALVLILPTVLMGATVPFVTRAMVDRDDNVGRVTAYIYAFNTFGACLGAYMTTFWLLPYVGIFRATLLTVGINLLVFVAAVVLGRDEKPIADTPTHQTEPAELEGNDTKLKAIGTVIAATLGFAAVALQVIWVRIFATAMDGTVYGTGSVLVAVLVGIGAGSLGLAPFLRRSPRAGLTFVALQIAGIGLIFLQLKLLPWISYELGAIQVQRLSTYGLHLQMTIVILAVLGPSLVSGASLPLIIGIVERRAAQSARTVGNVYAANTVGAIFGSLITGLVILPSAGSEGSVLIAIVALAGATAFGALFLVEAARPVALGLVVIPLLLAAQYDGYDVQMLAMGPSKGSFRTWWTQGQKSKSMSLMFAEAKSANVRVGESRTSRWLTLNALGQGGRNKEPPHLIQESLMMATVPLSHAKKTEHALLVGLGAGVTVHAMLQLGVDNIRVVELEPKVVEAVGMIFGDDNPVASERVDVIIDDARHYLNVQRLTGGQKYDLISSMPAHPWVASPIFTKEFFEIVKGNLHEDGVFCSWFGLREMNNLATDSLLRAFTSAFDHYVIYFLAAQGSYYLVGSRSPIDVSLPKYEAAFSHRIVKEHRLLRDKFFLPIRIVASSRGEGGPVLKPGPVNTDDRPIVEMLAPTATASRGHASTDLFEPRGLDPAMIPEAERADFLDGYLERLFGTPEGRLPLGRRIVRRRGAETAFARAKPFLPADAQAYFALRLDIEENVQNPQLPSRIDALTNPEYQMRARRVWADALPPLTKARADALSALPPETGVLLRLLDEKGLGALERVPTEPPVVENDPVGWWMWHLAHRRSFDAPTRQALLEQVGPKLIEANNELLLTQSAAVTRAAGAETLARIIERWGQDVRQRSAAVHIRQGIALARRRSFEKAKYHLWEAFLRVPQDGKLRYPLIRTLLETGDRARLKQATDTFRFQGLSEQQIDHLVEESGRRNQVFSAAAETSAADDEVKTLSGPRTP